MDSTDVKNAITHLEFIIKNAKLDIESIQNNCKHEDIEIVPQDGSAQAQIIKQCANCKKKLGYPSNDELIDAGYKENGKRE